MSGNTANAALHKAEIQNMLEKLKIRIVKYPRNPEWCLLEIIIFHLYTHISL